MDTKNVGGSPGGMKTFLLGIIMLTVGGYLLFNQVDIHGGYWRFSFLGGGGGSSFGITLIPLLFGIGILFTNGQSMIGRVLTGLGGLVIIVGIIVNMDMQFRRTSMWNTLVMLILIVGGIGLIVRAVMPMGQNKQDEAPRE
jgi:drug/metabolite transporter superfamily protein YnfA